MVRRLSENSGYNDEDLEKSLKTVERSYEQPTERLKGISGISEILLSDQELGTEQFKARKDAYDKLIELATRNKDRKKEEKLLDGYVIMELTHIESKEYMTVFSKDNFVDKGTGIIRPVRVVQSLHIGYNEQTRQSTYDTGGTILNAAPVAPIKKIYDPLFNMQKFEINFEYIGSGNTIKNKVVGPYTKQELIEYLKEETNFVYNERKPRNH